MNTLTTNGIKVSVQAQYEEESSNPALQRFIYSYRIVIENLSGETVQLLSRYWLIIDGDGTKREVRGEGVIGEQPVLKPMDIHSYTSWCPLSFPYGKMQGHFIMQNIETDQRFPADVPPFNLIAGYKQN